MEGLPIQLRAALRVTVDGLKGETAPTSLGYNDMAVMIAYGESDECGIPTINADMVSRFLLKNLAVPKDARMQPQVVQGYLERLEDAVLINKFLKLYENGSAIEICWTFPISS
mgnify:CR=1 FL=1